MQPDVASMNAVAVTFPLSGETVHKSPNGGQSTLRGAGMCSKVSDVTLARERELQLVRPWLEIQVGQLELSIGRLS